MNFNEQLIKACAKGQLDVVKHLLTDPDLKEYIDNRVNNDDGFILAFESDNIKITTLGFIVACANGHLDIVQYLLIASDLKEHADIHAADDSGFILACKNGHLNIVKYLIFDMNIDETESIQEYLDKNEEVENMFELRDLQNKLNANLTVKTNIKPKLNKI